MVQFTSLLKTIKEYNERIISDNELENINRELKKLVIIDKKIKKDISQQHIATVKLDLKKEKSTSNNKMSCPKCNSELVKRSGKYGDFYGCSNYPKCTYTRKFSN